MIGARFGRYTVLGFSHYGKNSRAYFKCVCDCGTEKSVQASSLKCGTTMSCGCLGREISSACNRTHGMSRSAEFKSWVSMFQRCYNSKCPAYKNYGARGISICDRWRFGENGRSGFECFFEDLGLLSGPDLSLDRWPDNNGNYEPSNCRWATAKQQRSGQRPPSAEDRASRAEKMSSRMLSRWQVIEYREARLKTLRSRARDVVGRFA